MSNVIHHFSTSRHRFNFTIVYLKNVKFIIYYHGYITLLPYECKTFVIFVFRKKIIYSIKIHMVISYKGVDFIAYYHGFPKTHTMLIRLVIHM